MQIDHLQLIVENETTRQTLKDLIHLEYQQKGITEEDRKDTKNKKKQKQI